MPIILNYKLLELLKEKDELVKAGRQVSVKIERVEAKIEKEKDLQRGYTNACNPAELIAEGGALQKQIEADLKKLEKIGNEVQKLKIASIPKVRIDAYEALKAEKEQLERERNKIALKVQKIKDRSIPIIQKEAKPFLGEFDDIETAVIKEGKIEINTFNHLDEYKKKFREKNGKK